MRSVSNIHYDLINQIKINDKNNPNWNGQAFQPIFSICYNNSQTGLRPKIAEINVPNRILNEIYETAKITDEIFNFTMNDFMSFESVESLNNYVRSKNYGSNEENPLLCFGLSFNKIDDIYNFSLHYFDSEVGGGIEDIPTGTQGLFNPHRKNSDIKRYEMYKSSGFTYLQKIICEYILQETTGNNNARINFALRPFEYEYYKEDNFGIYVGYIIPFFIVIAYMSPLCLYVYRMVNEKETKVKEGMKMMGLTENIYFLSYFIQFFVINIFYAITNSLVVYFIFPHIPWGVLCIIFFLFGINIFILAFFFQSFIDHTRIALIICLLIYYVMFFLSMAVINRSVKKWLKILTSFLPPVVLELGIIIIGDFEINFKNFEWKDINVVYRHYSMLYMFIMFIVDIFLYLFLGFYLQNIINHEFGISQKWYFLCTKKYWCDDYNKNKQVENELNTEENNEINNNNNIDNNNFESEDLYNDKTNNDKIIINSLKKIYDDGKIALNNISFNLYKEEIFALLGHNGAGKSSLINILSGMINSTSGKVLYESKNILEKSNMENFRLKLGICGQNDVLFEDLTVYEHLELFSIFKGVKNENIPNEIKKISVGFQLTEIENIIAKNLSAGQRRKLSIAIALIGGNDVIFLDEPSSGMDVSSRRNLWEILKKMSEKKIIILTTHFMEEAAVLGNRIGIINNGNMKCIGTPLFLIKKFGKFMSLNVSKENDCDDAKIVDFIKKFWNDCEYKILSEEILFRIAQNNDDKLNINQSNNNNIKNNLQNFVEELDNNLESLKIKSYSVSMPTLEDVFLNITKDSNEEKEENFDIKNITKNEKENDKILFESDFREDYSNKSKFLTDFQALFKKRFFMTFRDIKSFFLEILCPIIIVFIGLLVCQVEFVWETPPYEVDINILGKQKIKYGRLNNLDIPEIFLQKGTNTTYSVIKTKQDNYNNNAEAIQAFADELFNIDSDDNIGGVYFLDLDKNNHVYNYIVYTNSIADHAPNYYCYYFLNQIINYANNKPIKIHFYNIPMALTTDLQSTSNQTNNTIVVFFVSIAFALIPANFVTIIVKERINNSKHIMHLSGINFFAYWLVNYIFELIKYYFTGGVCLLLIYLFDYFPKYFWILYICLGPSMISNTYFFSFLFSSESSAQNGVILINFLIGGLASTVALMFRGLESAATVGKIFVYVFGIIPSFNFSYGYSYLLNKYLVWIVDKPNTWMYLTDKDSLGIKYLGLQILYLCVLFVLYTFFVILFEIYEYKLKECKNEKIKNESEDDNVNKEINYVQNVIDNIDNNVQIDKEEENNKIKHPIIVQNLQKFYTKFNFCSNNEKIPAVKNLNFCTNSGECFGLLGTNGAGKTTTFKCLTQEHSLSNGQILINNIKLNSSNFSKFSFLFGYCPQFDAIFEYLTVFENLEFYALIKGIKKTLLSSFINAMIEEMSLNEFSNKIAGRLSGGNKRKLSVAISMICNPQIILLDEPSTGLDPEARRFMWSIIYKIISYPKNNNSVIMTTHSMDEAETLCKKMGIMVDGEFVCLGSSYQIKEKFGYGFEIQIRIKPLNRIELKEIKNKFQLDNFDEFVEKDKLNDVFKLINKENYLNEIKEGGFGEKLLKDLKENGNKIKINIILSWCHYIENVIKIIKRAKENFNEIILSEYIDNNFLFKIKKEEDKKKSIGFLFALFEKYKDECNVTEYSIQQTSLEQIFNRFAEKNNEYNKNKKEILISDELINNLYKL